MSKAHSGPAGTVAKTLISRRQFRYYDLLVHVFVVVLLVSNLVAQKLCAIGPFTIGGMEFGPFLISGAQILFPITYIFGDIFVEVYGYGASRRAIWIGFFSSALLVIMAQITTSLPPAPRVGGQPRRLLVRGVRQRFRNVEDENLDRGQTPVDTHDRLDRCGTGDRYRRRHHGFVRRNSFLLDDVESDLHRLLRESHLRSGRHAIDVLGSQYAQTRRGH